MSEKSPLLNDVPDNPKVEKERQTVNRYWQRYQRAMFAVQDKHKLWNTLDTFDRGEQWKGVAMPPWMPKPVTNYIRYTRTLKRANLAGAIPKANFSPVAREDSGLVNKYQKAYDHVWEEEKVDRMVRRCIDRALLEGTSIGYVWWDEDYVGGKYYQENDARNNLYDGRICVKRFPNANFFPDPDSYTIQGCKYIEITEPIALNTVINHQAFVKYTKDNGTHEKLKTLKSTMLTPDAGGNGEIYERENKPSNNQFGSQLGEEMGLLHAHFERYLTKSGKWQLDITYYLENTDFILLRLENVKPSCYPFATLYDEQEENDFWGTSQSMDILENQKVINKTSQTASVISMLHQNPQKVVQRESGINAQELARTGTLAGKVWQSNIPQPIEFLQHPDIPSGTFELEDRMKQDIREMVGVSEAYTGESVGSLTTSTGVDSLIERATIRDKDKMTNIDNFVEDLSDLIMMFIVEHWKEKRPIVRRQPNGQPEFEEFEPEKGLTLENFKWRVKSDVYAKSPMTQAQKRQQADKLMQMQGQFQFNPPIITPEEWIRFQDFDMKEEILQRMEEDRIKLEQQETETMTQNIMMLIQQANEMSKQGMSSEEINGQMQMAVQQIIQSTQSTGASQTLEAGGVGSAPSETSMPSGSTSQIAAANMASGN